MFSKSISRMERSYLIMDNDKTLFSRYQCMITKKRGFLFFSVILFQYHYENPASVTFIPTWHTTSLLIGIGRGQIKRVHSYSLYLNFHTRRILGTMAKVFIESLLGSPPYFAHVVVKPIFKIKWPLQQICLKQQ